MTTKNNLSMYLKTNLGYLVKYLQRCWVSLIIITILFYPTKNIEPLRIYFKNAIIFYKNFQRILVTKLMRNSFSKREICLLGLFLIFLFFR